LKPEEAKQVCEAQYLGIEMEGVTSNVHPNVVGIGLGKKKTRGMATQDVAVKFYVKEKLHPLFVKDGEVIPDEIEGVPTDIEQSGEFSIWRPIPPIYHRKVRPAMGGLSVGHYAITAGTLGCLVKRGQDTCILSNNHVLANENRGVEGDPILQPGRFDGGKEDKDVIARLDSFVKVEAEATNTVDAALALPFDARDVTPEILNIGRIRGTRAADLDEKVMKSGRTTRVTNGVVQDISATLRVGYATGSYLFTDQMIIQGDKGSFSAGGDSGALIVDYQGSAVGLLFAGSPFFTVANKIENVQSALSVKVL
jgi:hypothetical protein